LIGAANAICGESVLSPGIPGESLVGRTTRDSELTRGSGTTLQDVNNLLRQYGQMRKMFKTMGSGGGMKAQQRMMSQMQGRQKFGR
jgi:signal recognition particle GTPase